MCEWAVFLHKWDTLYPGSVLDLYKKIISSQSHSLCRMRENFCFYLNEKIYICETEYSTNYKVCCNVEATRCYCMNILHTFEYILNANAILTGLCLTLHLLCTLPTYSVMKIWMNEWMARWMVWMVDGLDKKGKQTIFDFISTIPYHSHSLIIINFTVFIYQQKFFIFVFIFYFPLIVS